MERERLEEAEDYVEGCVPRFAEVHPEGPLQVVNSWVHIPPRAPEREIPGMPPPPPKAGAPANAMSAEEVAIVEQLLYADGSQTPPLVVPAEEVEIMERLMDPDGTQAPPAAPPADHVFTPSQARRLYGAFASDSDGQVCVVQFFS